MLDQTFIAALLDDTSDQHAGAARLYAELIQRYVAGHDGLFALSTVVDTVAVTVRRQSLAPVETLWIARQHRRAAAEVVGTASFDAKLTLVVMQRERIRTVATTSIEYDHLDIEVLRADESTLTVDQPHGISQLSN